MVWIPGGTFQMGSASHYPEERPVHRVTVDGFWIDRSPVTNEQFERFAAATGHTTFAEIPPKAEDYPGALPEMSVSGFARVHEAGTPRQSHRLRELVALRARRRLAAPVRARELRSRGCRCIRSCTSPISDAEKFAQWEGKELPTEAEWEFAARGGLDGAAYAWGDEFMPDGRPMANTWQGRLSV